MGQVVSARGLQKGKWYYGRDNWHLKVERVTVSAKSVTITATNKFGEEKKERYTREAYVELLEQKS